MEPATTRREIRKQDRREAIVDAARASFLEQGYAGTSMSGLLKTLGGSKATLWSYFRSKEELFAAVIEQVSASFRSELGGVLGSATGLEAGLIAFCRRFLLTIGSPDAVATWRMVVAESGRFPELGRIFYDRAAGFTETTLSAYLARHVATGELRSEDPKIMAQTLISLCAGRHNRLLWGVDVEEPGAIDLQARRFADVFMRAYGVAATGEASR
ncbi:TetR/AcrR family transcriptional regulator TvrR [Sphingomonas oligophenolica]|uniref:TetR/AcrR family transcriptional regulator n=1 Tax=Sphingomonas oligophenolica TaxID=301154 RepID=A0ABU9YB96_9SPHN